MKNLLLLLFPIAFWAQDNSTAPPELNWQLNYQTAIETSKESKENILIYFTGSDWCAPCKKLKQDLLLTEEFKALGGKYVLLYIDLPMNKRLLSSTQLTHNKALLTRFNRKGVFPMMVVIDSDENVLDEMSGYGMKESIPRYISFLTKNQE